MGVLAIIGAAAAALILGTAFAGEHPAVTVVKEAAVYVPPTDGAAMYDRYCASCHGSDGRGHGPAISGLIDDPVDLTLLSAANDGEFPRHHVRYVLLDAGPESSHACDMPEWSFVLGELNRDNPGTKMLRVRNLSEYLESIQEPPVLARK
jgi:cytochrome c1